MRNFLAEYKGNINNIHKLKQAVYVFLSDKKSGHFNKLLQALRQFFDYIIGEGLLKDNPCLGLKYKRCNARIVHHDEKSNKAFINLPDKEKLRRSWDYMIIISILDATGIRPNELLQIRIKDIDFFECTNLYSRRICKLDNQDLYHYQHRPRMD